jgi:RNA polymerase sigma factor (sigma-70 family)
MKLNAEQGMFVAKYHTFAIKYARRWTRYMRQYEEDLNDAALDGLIVASQGVNPNEGFIAWCVRSAITSKIRYLRAQKRGSKHKIGQLVSDPGYYQRLPDGMTDFDGMIASLNANHQQVLRLRFKDDLSWGEIAQQVGGCILTAQRAKNEAIKKLRERL